MLILNIILFFMWFFVGGLDWFIDCLDCIEALQAAEMLYEEDNIRELFLNWRAQMPENAYIEETNQFLDEEEPD
jgi:hypothetical protein